MISDVFLYKLQGIIQDRRLGHFIVSIAHAIVSVPESYNSSHHLAALAGSSGGYGWKIDKVFEEATFSYPGDMLPLTKGKFLVDAWKSPVDLFCNYI